MIDIPPHIQGLIFDCDGTIADTMPLHYRAWKQALGEYGHDFPEALFYEMAGIPTPVIMQILNERHGYHLPVEEASERKELLFVESIPQILPVEPVVQLVRQNAGRLPMAVATGGTRAICMKTLTALGLADAFLSIVTADDVAHGKPAPDIFLEAARRIKAEPAHCMAFEDGEPGFRAAGAAGMVVVDVRPWYLTGDRALPAAR
jgi:HAD superfamily hydrolase (TIGR01509 family)